MLLRPNMRLDGEHQSCSHFVSTNLSWPRMIPECVMLGLLLLVLAVRRWQTRPGKDEEPEMPCWMAAIDRFGPVKSIGMAAFLSGLNPKNLALTIGTASTIAAAGVGTGREVLGLTIFIVLGSITIAAPVIFYQLMGQSAECGLNRLKNWLVPNNLQVLQLVKHLVGTDAYPLTTGR